jgi:hypothetical protein
LITVDEIRDRIARIDDASDDSEHAHREEDRLYCDVLKAIADGAPDPAGLARAALEARDLLFDRCYAWPNN